MTRPAPLRRALAAAPRIARGGLFVSLGVALLVFAPPDRSRVRGDEVAPSSGEERPEDGFEIGYFTYFSGWPSDSHPLDGLPRFLDEGGRVRCDASGLVRHQSTSLRYGVRVHPAFARRLERFEGLVIRLAIEHYGRAPRRLVHRGAYACRRARGRRGRISEHAFGNALDLQGFDFPALPRGASAPEGLPRSLRRSFQLRVRRHWSPRRSQDAPHARFLHRLAEVIRARPGIFRGIVGPPRPRHGDHLHLDAAPWRYAMFSYDPVD